LERDEVGHLLIERDNVFMVGDLICTDIQSIQLG
jgi:hypothetical protein